MPHLPQRLRATLATAGLLLAAGASAEQLTAADWAGIEQQARGQTVSWYMWGGSDRINAYVSEYLGGLARERYGITIRRVGINDTAEAVNAVLQEMEAGVDKEGSVDLIWINGENFRTLRQADAVRCGYLDALPNNRLVDWSNPAISYDFGTPVDECEVPWNRAQFVFAYDSARLTDPPRSMGALLEWIEANPGRFTYAAPPDFTGSVFVRHVFYHVAGGPERLLGEFNQEVYDEVAAETWALLNRLKPSLWRQGQTYPRDGAALGQLFANQEIDFHFSYDAAGYGTGVDAGTYPATTRSYGLADGTIGNTNYMAIPANASNAAAAMVVANLALSAEAQLEKAKPSVWGASPVIDIERLSAAEREGFAALPRHPSVVSSAELARASLPELLAPWVVAIEAGWREHVGSD